MAETVNVREIVLNMLLEVSKDGKPSSQVLADWLAKYQYLDKSDRRFMSRLMRTTLENQLFIDTVMNHYSSVRVNKMKPVVRTIIEMGICQMLFMDGVPDHAVCNESVNLAVRKGLKGLKGFVNGVLRTIARNKDDVWKLIPDREKCPKEYLSVRYSAPMWLCKMWYDDYGMDAAEKMLSYAASDNTTSIRVNTIKITPKKLKEKLEGQGISVKNGSFLPYVLKISGYDYLAALESFTDGEFMVQDESSALAGACAGFLPDMKVLDICGAPGGKSMNAALLMEDKGEILCRDAAASKIGRIQENVKRMGIGCVKAEHWDALILDEHLVESADVVIADVPCSGLGVIGKKTDIKYRMNPQNIASLVTLQRKILDTAWRYVKPGGILLYSTCTVNPEENQAQVDYLTEHYPLTGESLDDFLPESLKSETTRQGYLQLLPGIHQCDGFFMAKLRKRGRADGK